MLAQTPQQVEQDMQAHLKHIRYWRFEYSPDDTVFKAQVSPKDSLVVANTMLLNYLLKVCDKNAELLRYNFKLPENSDMRIVTSDDKKLRFYSWDSHTGENEHDYYTVSQYETPKGVRAGTDIYKHKDKQGKGYQKIYTLPIYNERVPEWKDKKIYLVIASDIASDNNIRKTITSYMLDPEEKNLSRGLDMFREEGKPNLEYLEYVYNYSSNYDFKKMKEEYETRYEKGKLYVPEVKDYKMTGKYFVYNYDGLNFILDKNAK